MGKTMGPKEVIKMAKENNVRVVDIRYTDFIGTWQHFSVPLSIPIYSFHT